MNQSVFISRLDFDKFNIMGPETMNNVCNNDQFIVTGGNPVPAICGNNVGNHSKCIKILNSVIIVCKLVLLEL